MKVFIQFVASLFLFSFFISCDPAPSKLKALSDFIPMNPSVVFSINDFEALKSDLKSNSFLSNLKNAQAYSYLKNKEIFKHLHPNSKSILCISDGNDEPAFTFMTKLSKDLFNLDSIADHTIENSSFNSFTFQKVIINKQAIFTTVEDSIFFASNSKKTLANIISGKNENNAIFKKITALSNQQDLTAFIPANEILANQILFNFGSWAALNIEVLPDALTASGVVLTNDSVPQLISVFKGLNPQQNEIAKVTPTNAHTVVSFTFDDFALFQNNLQNFRGIKSIKDEETILFEAVNEVSKISFSKNFS